MSSGANIGDGGPNGIGDDPTDLGAWEKFQLGWLGCASCAEAASSTTSLAGTSPSTSSARTTPPRKEAQALFVVLPDKQRGDARRRRKTGCGLLLSSMGDNLDNTMTKTVTSPAGGDADRRRCATTIEEHLDYAFLEVVDATAATWTPLLTNLLAARVGGPERQINASGTGIDGTQRWRLRRADGDRARAGTTSISGSGTRRTAAVAEQGLRDRRHRRSTVARSTDAETDAGLDVRRLPADDRHGDELPLQRVRRREPAVPRLRHVAADGVQLRLPRLEAGLGRALPVPERPPDQLLGQRRSSDNNVGDHPGRGPDPAGRRASELHHSVGRASGCRGRGSAVVSTRPSGSSVTAMPITLHKNKRA